jgi:hypothetical protein
LFEQWLWFLEGKKVVVGVLEKKELDFDYS